MVYGNECHDKRAGLVMILVACHVCMVGARGNNCNVGVIVLSDG